MTQLAKNEEIQKQVNSRNYGIDLLRIVAMFLVVILHILGQGGVLKAVESNEINFTVSWLLEIGAYCAVNCYALITGFVCFSEKDKSLKISKYILLWLQVAFYSILITLLFLIFQAKTVSVKELIKSVFPVASSQYWYFSAYTGVFFMIPWLNKIVQNFEKRYVKVFMIYIFGFSLYVTIAKVFGDPFILKEGYSFLWLAILYVIGAVIKKYEIYKKVKKKKAIIILMILIIFTLIWKVGISKLTTYLFGKKRLTDLFVSYVSPTILGVAVLLLLVFTNLKIKTCLKKFIIFVSSSAFGVYLIHVQPLVFEYIIRERYTYIGNLQAYLIPIVVVLNAIIIFIMGIFIDKIRMMLFELFKVNRLAEKIENIISNVINRFV